MSRESRNPKISRVEREPWRPPRPFRRPPLTAGPVPMSRSRAVTRERERTLASPRRALRGALLLLGAACCGGTACRSADDWAGAADAETYALIQERRFELFGAEDGFHIDPPLDSLRQRILRGEPTDTAQLSMVECLRIAAENSRDFQSRKEDVYGEALDVTLERWRLGVIADPTARTGATGLGDRGGVASANADLGLAKVLGSGASILSNIGLGLVRVIGSGGGWESISALTLDVTQPLLRGSGSRIVKEPLTQAERDLVYEVRAFERFRRTFAVDVANQYFDILRQVDRVKNEEANFEALRLIRERNEAFARAGRLNEIEVDQARQDEIRSINRLVLERNTYQNQIDAFKLFLGLPIQCELGLDSGELARLREAILEPVEYASESVIDFALRNRLDYLTALDQVGDSERQVYVAADQLRPGLDIGFQGLLPSETGEPLNYSLDRLAWQATLEFDLPVDLVPERNSYRSALISMQVGVRSMEQLGDTISVDLREALRGVQTTLESYEIQVGAERLADRRVESVRLNQQAGRASTRDLLESQNALLDAQNSTVLALVEHHLAKLALYRDMEILMVDEEGIRIEAERFERELEEGS